jgi:hypothetical protein
VSPAVHALPATSVHAGPVALASVASTRRRWSGVSRGFVMLRSLASVRMLVRERDGKYLAEASTVRDAIVAARRTS